MMNWMEFAWLVGFLLLWHHAWLACHIVILAELCSKLWHVGMDWIPLIVCMVMMMDVK
jgi:hypothetical protein